MILLTIDSTQVIISAISGVVSIISLLITLLISKKQTVINKQINGMQEKLIFAEKAASKSEGKEELRQEQKNEIPVSVDNPMAVEVVNKEPIAVKKI